MNITESKEIMSDEELVERLGTLDRSSLAIVKAYADGMEAGKEIEKENLKEKIR